ncbi:fumarylacetoacetate hydrolase family protein [Sphingobium subterraneum]|uniref:2-oxopent-4-enoate/cis-2-oxohex-4-enoate hydratase n=1 Tax=Sphingobium subterraneum TaxID=627688 RepID=A0A841JB42_9SPHN|nr:fumarylacetoacetate hydrolase family protein [Sphingobium subterraneum]MBB6125341.1 2-oxopent-4-enoate/cis-2-oxohex-4-enoate hydratase [Sphingobium subterraneum]
MSQEARVQNYSDELFEALRANRTVPPLRHREELTIDDAYRISLGILARRENEGERVVGKKIGVTSKAVQDMLGVDRPDFGFLTHPMQVPSGSAYPIEGNLIAPRAEAEIAFILRSDLIGPGVTEDDVLAATESVCACFEIVDSRIAGWDIKIIDTIADNASCGIFVLGEERVDPRDLDLPGLHCQVWKNGVALSEGYGSAVQGSPLTAVAWLANTLGAYDVALKAGDIILSGSLVPLEPAAPGDEFEMAIDGLGKAKIGFR